MVLPPLWLKNSRKINNQKGGDKVGKVAGNEKISNSHSSVQAEIVKDSMGVE